MPTVSVIIPCFNQGQFVDEAVDSVLEQSYDDYEIIIINDGSTDPQTNLLLHNYQKPKTRVITTENQGLAAARNNGIAAAGGKYILPLDADDIIGPTYLEQAVGILESDQEIGIVYCRARLFGSVNTEWMLPEFSMERMLLDNVIFCSGFFRIEDFNAVGGYDVSMKYGWEDYDFWLSLLTRGKKVFRIPEILFHYRVSGDSMVRARPRQHKLDTFVALYRKHQSLFSQYIHVWVDKLLDSSMTYQEARLIPPGMSRETAPENYVRKVDGSTNRLEISLDELPPGQYTFYPADDQVVLTINEILLESDNRSDTRLDWQSNADFSDETRLFFVSNTPKVTFFIEDDQQSKTECSKLILELHYHGFGRDCLSLLATYVRDLETRTQQAELDRMKRSALNKPSQGATLLGLNKVLLRRFLKSALFYLKSDVYRDLKRSGIFDADYYLNMDKGIDPLLIDPLIHYLQTGAQEGRNPSRLFENDWYGKRNKLGPDTDSLLHYIRHGWQEGNDPCPLFFTSFYLEQHPECVKSGLTPLGHYLKKGWKKGWKPNPLFDPHFYLQTHQGVVSAGINPLEHYLLFGNEEEFNPSPFFDMGYYLENNPSVERNQINALVHFICFGAEEGVSPNRFFDPEYYRKTYCLEDLSPLDLFIHYATTGYLEKKKPNRLFDPVFYENSYPDIQEKGAGALVAYQEKGVFLKHSPCAEIAELKSKPVISILTPVFETDTLLLEKCIHSVLFQAYPHWELCLVDDGSKQSHIKEILAHFADLDPRIRVKYLNHNMGISEATNAAADMATGDFIGFLDHDDELTPDALFEIALAINEHDPDMLYCDEELVNLESRHLDSFFKPDYNEELLLTHNYITHFLVTRRSLFEKTGGFRKECSGAQDYDLTFKLTEISESIHHIPRILYRWRAHETSTSINHTQKDYADDAGMIALKEALKRRGVKAEVSHGEWKYYYRVHPVLTERASVSIIVVFPDGGKSLGNWYEGMRGFFDYEPLEIICICYGNTGSTDGQISVEHNGALKVIGHNEAWNISSMLNRAVSESTGQHLLFLSCDVLPMEQGWISSLLEHSQAQNNGVVGGWIEQNPAETATISALPDLLDRSWRYYSDFFKNCSVHANSFVCSQNVLSVSTDLCMVKRSLFDAVKGFTETRFSTVLHDADFCLRVRQCGVENVYTPFCKASRKARQVVPVNDAQAEADVSFFKEKWRDLLLTGDPYYNIGRLQKELHVSREQWLDWYAR